MRDQCVCASGRETRKILVLDTSLSLKKKRLHASIDTNATPHACMQANTLSPPRPASPANPLPRCPSSLTVHLLRSFTDAESTTTTFHPFAGWISRITLRKRSRAVARMEPCTYPHGGGWQMRGTRRYESTTSGCSPCAMSAALAIARAPRSHLRRRWHPERPSPAVKR